MKRYPVDQNNTFEHTPGDSTAVLVHQLNWCTSEYRSTVEIREIIMTARGEESFPILTDEGDQGMYTVSREAFRKFLGRLYIEAQMEKLSLADPLEMYLDKVYETEASVLGRGTIPQ